MSLTFYGAPQSTASLTEAVLAELALDCTRVVLDISAGDTRTPQFLQINPNGRVPVLVHDGVPIWESAAITIYLGELHGVAAGLYPAAGPARGEAMKWIVWSNVNLAEAAGRLSAMLPSDAEGAVQANSQDWVAPEARSDAALAKAQADLAACFRILERGLEDRDFLLGRYSLADTHVQGFVGWIAAMGINLEEYPNVLRWLARCAARPALARLAEQP